MSEDDALPAESAPEGAAFSFEVDIRAHGFDLTPALRQYATDHVVAKLAKHSQQIETVVVRMEDINGTKGGEDKVCRVEVIIAGKPPLVVEERSEDLRAAMDLVSDRIEKVLVRAIKRRATKPRQEGRKVARARKVLH